MSLQDTVIFLGQMILAGVMCTAVLYLVDQVFDPRKEK